MFYHRHVANCQVIVPVVNPFLSHTSVTLFNGLLGFLLPFGLF